MATHQVIAALSARTRRTKLSPGALALVAATTASWPGAVAPESYVYPNAGQSQEQQDRHRYECHNWAVGQPGYDPTRPQAATPGAPPPQANAARGAVGGAAIGALGGAIGGNVGTGA